MRIMIEKRKGMRMIMRKKEEIKGNKKKGETKGNENGNKVTKRNENYEEEIKGIKIDDGEMKRSIMIM
jgi:hypothetical protein